MRVAVGSDHRASVNQNSFADLDIGFDYSVSLHDRVLSDHHSLADEYSRINHHARP
jgi:hypothetical protein